MSILKFTMGVIGGVIQGAATASLWSGNMIYTGLQNAKTEREIKQLYRHACEANLQNRGLALSAGGNKQQLLLACGDEDDDVYDYPAQSNTQALDYIWGLSNASENMVVSGGQNSQRLLALLPFVRKLQQASLALIVLHTGNSDLERMLQEHYPNCELISERECFYDLFRGMPVEDIAFLLYETMPKELRTPAAESLLRALIEVLLLVDGKITLQNLAQFPLRLLKDKIDGMRKDGVLDSQKYDQLSLYCMAGSVQTDSLRMYLSNLNRQFEAVYGKSLSCRSNIKAMLHKKGAIVINLGSFGNELLVSLALHHLQLLQSQGKQFGILFDNMAIAKYGQIANLLGAQAYAIINQDFMASLHAGEINAQDWFAHIMGKVDTTVLLRHASVSSCEKWSEYFGKYKKIRIRCQITQNNAFLNSSNSRGMSVDEVDEARVKAQTLGILPDEWACIHRSDGILIAQLKR